jgi:hypothetical protein
MANTKIFKYDLPKQVNFELKKWLNQVFILFWQYHKYHACFFTRRDYL